MRLIALAAAAALSAATPCLAQAQKPAPPTVAKAPPTAAKPPGPSSTMRDLLKDPRTRAVLQKHVPRIVMIIDRGIADSSSTLKQTSENGQARTIGGFTAEAYAKILADFAKL